MIKVGTVKSLWRYPVKGMAGEQLQTASLSELGIEGDRIWAVQDVDKQEIQSCKFRPQLLQCRATSIVQPPGDPTVDIHFPDGSILASTDSEASKKVSALVGHASRLCPLQPKSNRAFYQRYKANNHPWLDELKNTFEREPGEPLPDFDNLPPEFEEYVSLLGTFFLVSPFHLLTTASLAHMQSINPAADWREERFRPNIVIATDPSIQGLAEQTWLGSTLKIGDLEINCQEPAPRCGAVVREQDNLAEDKSILRSIVRDAEQNLGIYAAINGSQEISVGEDVYLQES